MEKEIELQPIPETTSDFERMEKRIKLAFKKYLYHPLLRELDLNRGVITNSRDDLVRALETGRITVSRGTFSGQFDAETSKALKRLGAKFDKKSATFKIPVSELPMEIRDAIATANVRFEERMARIDKRLAQFSPEDFAGKVKTKDLFAATLDKTDAKISASVKKISVYPKLDPKERERIAEEWQDNMDLWINNFTKEEIVRLRKDIAASVVEGNRHEAMVKSIQRSYGVTANKAKFLARQETSLLMAKFKETRYASSGINNYKWRCVAGSKNHPVRPSHKILDGKIFRWDNPPITTAPDEPTRRNNPGQDYNCRCTAVPIVKFIKRA